MKLLPFNTVKDVSEEPDESNKKGKPPIEVPIREEGEEYISINDDPRRTYTPQS